MTTLCPSSVHELLPRLSRRLRVPRGTFDRAHPFDRDRAEQLAELTLVHAGYLGSVQRVRRRPCPSTAPPHSLRATPLSASPKPANVLDTSTSKELMSVPAGMLVMRLFPQTFFRRACEQHC